MENSQVVVEGRLSVERLKLTRHAEFAQGADISDPAVLNGLREQVDAPDAPVTDEIRELVASWARKWRVLSPRLKANRYAAYVW